MKTTIVLFFGLVLSAVQAYTPPTDQGDGAYAVRFDANGNPITKRFEMAREVSRGAPPPPAPQVQSQSQVIERRDFPGQQVSCTGRTITNHYDYGFVQNCLGTWLNKNTNNHADKTVYYCRSGDTLLAICNYPQTIYGSSGEIDNFNDVMDRTCGAWQSGFVFIKDWNKTYWRTTWGESICENAGGLREQVYS